MSVALLETVDIFDFYGCEYLYTNRDVDFEGKKKAEWRIREIHKKYVNAVKERIKAEMRFIGIFTPVNSIADAMVAIDKYMDKETEKQAAMVAAGFGGFNLMKMVIESNKMKGEDVSDVDGMFGSKKARPKKAEPYKGPSINSSLIKDNPKWKVIAEVFTELEKANGANSIIQAIDKLNDLQHNSFHLLIDLQTGRMLESESKGGLKGKHEVAVNAVKEVLDLKSSAKSPKDFLDKMSEEVREMYKVYRFVN